MIKKLSSFILAASLFVITALWMTPNAFADTTGNYVTNGQRSGQFSVPANLEAGVTLTNKTNESILVTISTEGTWNVSDAIKNLNANGLESKYVQAAIPYLQYPEKAPFSMLAVNQDKNPPTVFQVGTQSKLTIAPGATFSFLVNDMRTVYLPTSYNDNTGSLIVKWSTPPNTPSSQPPESSQTPQIGKIVVNADEFTFSNTGFTEAPDTVTFVTNIAKWFTGGRSTGNFHGYSTNFGLTESVLAQTMAKAGYAWTVGKNIKFDLPTLLTYDGIFLSGDSVDNQVLIDYVKAGGNVYLAGGTGWGGSQQEADRWNTFLNAFGLKLLGVYNGISGNQAVNSSHPIFAGVKAIFQGNGNSIVDLDAASQTNQIILTHPTGQGLIAARV